MEYYKYVERDVDSQINWAEVGKNLSDVLLEEKRVREEKKDAIDQGIRESLNNLSNAPKGQNQDVNDVLSNFTNDMMQQEFLDEKLLKSGKMDPKLWTLRHQNRKDGTDKVFKIGTVLQENSKTIMDGINNNEIQNALGLHNMSSIEELGNLNNIRITTNPLNGQLGIAKYENKIIDGKEVRVLSNDNTPVDVLMNMIHYQPKKFDVNAATSATAKDFGSRFQAVYQAASTARAGTISEFLGTQAMDSKKYPQFKGIVDKMNDAINDQVGSYLATNLNIVSVLGDNTGNYSSESFTYDKDVAAKDPKKILLKIDPRTQTPVMDDSAPNFEKQKKEAFDWVKTNLMSKLDSEAKVSVTSQLSERTPRVPRTPTEAETKAKAAAKQSETAANLIGQLYYGDQQQVDEAISYFKGMKNKEGLPIFDQIKRTSEGIKVILPDGSEENILFGGKTQEQFITAASPLLAGGLDVKTALEKGAYKKGATFNPKVSASGRNIKPSETYGKYIEENLDSSIIGKTEEDAFSEIEKIAKLGGFEVEETGVGNYIEIRNPMTKAKETFSFSESDPEQQKAVKKKIVDFLKANALTSSLKKSLVGYSPTSKKSAPVKKVKNPKGVGSKY